MDPTYYTNPNKQATALAPLVLLGVNGCYWVLPAVLMPAARLAGGNFLLADVLREGQPWTLGLALKHPRHLLHAHARAHVRAHHRLRVPQLELQGGT
eukprot:6266773-Pyramimonas_sp.AAC.2